jgi:L-cysteine desulfidase
MINGFSESTFFQLGLICFTIIGLANLSGVIIDWSNLTWWLKVSRTASMAFNFVVAYFFYYLTSKLPKPIKAEELKEFFK